MSNLVFIAGFTVGIAFSLTIVFIGTVLFCATFSPKEVGEFLINRGQERKV